MNLIIDTELIRYKWASVNGDYPDWQKLIPTEFHTFASFDTVEAIKAVNSLKTLSEKPKDYPIDITIGDGKVVMANPDDKGQAELVADTDGEVKVRIDGQYLAQALKACGGMVDFKVSSPLSPMLFSANGYLLVVMPMITSEAQKAEAEKAKAKAEKPTEPKAKGKGKGKTEPEPVTEPVAEPVAKAEPPPTEQAEPVAEKPKKASRSRKAKEAVTV